MEEIVIRSAAPDDASAVADLSTQLGYPASPVDSRKRLESVLRSQDDAVLVGCSRSGEVLGWIHVSLVLRIESERFAELGGFVVSDRHRRQDIGKRLLAAAEKWAARRGVSRLRVRTRVARTGAKLFYECTGFTEIKQQRVFDKLLEDRT